jgi:hypothetical protein
MELFKEQLQAHPVAKYFYLVEQTLKATFLFGADEVTLSTCTLNSIS